MTRETKSPAPVSVVLPCYRCLDTIGRALASVSAQSLQAAEVVLVDDCSGDGTLDELYRLRQAHPEGWIKVVSLSINGGPGTARNAGWAAATQLYIAFLDADDAWREDKLAIQYRAMQANSSAVLSGHGYGRAFDRSPVSIAEPAVHKIGIRKLLLKNRFCTSTAMLKREFPARFVAGKRYCEDYDLWLQILADGQEALYIDAPLAVHHKAYYGADGLSSHHWRMETGELGAYRHLYRSGKINAALLAAVSCWSIGKYALRLLMMSFKRKSGRIG